MSKAKRDEQIDEDILQSKADVLRARDIIPPYKKKTSQEPKQEETSENTTAAADKSFEKEKTAREETTESQTEAAGVRQEKSEIPRFDLAEEIMAEQRKITAIKRKAPGEKVEPEAKPADGTVVKPAPGQPYKDKIIAEIVARDIERLYRGDNSMDSR